MTEPLTPAGCDLTDFAFMPLDVARLRDSELASNETPEACWAAVLLWAASWHQIPAASMPNDDRWIAKAAGYAQRGKIADEWEVVREGALRGWVECSDGRLYHPVVAEKAVDAWQAKLVQRHKTECARIKKHNDRHETLVPKPTFEEWLSLGCPVGQPLFVPRDTHTCPPQVPEEMTSKGEGEGQREEKKDTHTQPIALPENFALPLAWGEWAREEFPHWSVDEVRAIAAQFADHQRVKSNVSSDWLASWRKWCRDDLTQKAHPAAPRAPKNYNTQEQRLNHVPDAETAEQAARAIARSRAENERLRKESLSPENAAARDAARAKFGRSKVAA